MKFSLVFLVAILLTGCDVGYITDSDRIIKHIKDCEAIGKVAQLRSNPNAGSKLVPHGCKEKVRSSDQ